MSKFRGDACRDWQAAAPPPPPGPPAQQQYCYVDPGKRRLGDWHQRGSYPEDSSTVAVDSFGAVINVVCADKFGGASTEECSTESCAPVQECSFKRCLKRSSGNNSIRGGPSTPATSPSELVSCTSCQSAPSDVAGPPVNRLPLQVPYHDAHVGAERENACARGVSRHSVDPTRISFFSNKYTYNMDSAAESSGSHGRQSSQDSSDHINHLRFDYKFASAALEETLLARMETRQKLQDETPAPERCSHVISPEYLVWGSVKHYIGMVLDRETKSLLGTAVLFTPSPDQAISCPVTAKSAWVTAIQAVEGRTEVLIKNYRGVTHVAHLVLTSPAVGLALFSVNVCQGTFALAFLSRVSGPHRLFAEVARNDRVYVIGYEESAATSDARVRPGRIVDAGRHTVVEIDFTTGLLGGSITRPGGFRGGLVVRADGLVAGVVTGERLPTHATNIDFSSAYNIHALLEELQLPFPPRPL